MDMDKTIGGLSEQFFDMELSPIRHVYMDAECIQDFDIGTLLTMISTEVEFDYMVSKLPTYNLVTDGTCVEHFPALNITEEQLNTAKTKLKNTHRLAECSPVTNLYNDLSNFIMGIVDHNNKCPKQLSKWTIHINHNNVQYTELEQDNIATFLQLLCPSIVTEFHGIDIHLHSEHFLKKIDYFILDDITHFMKPDSKILSMLAVDRVWEDRYIAAVLRSDPNVDFSEEDMDVVFDKTRTILDLLCNFTFITKTIALVDSEVSDE